MSLTMVQLRPDMGQVMRFAERQGLLPNRCGDDLGYAFHALLRAAFGEMAPKPFAFLHDSASERPKPPHLLGYAETPAEALRGHAATFAEPEVAEALGVAGLASKTMPERFAVGARLGFEVRVRPMVRTDRDGNRSRTKEVDAFVLSPPGSNRGEIYAAWLGARLAAGGANIESATLTRFQRSVVARRGAAGSDGRRPVRPQEGPDATFAGTLVVRDANAFSVLLARGVGRHRAFAFGMLLLKPPR